MVDHCSAGWSVDESLSLGGDVRDVTVQWCLIAEALHRSVHTQGTRTATARWSRANGGVTLHHNLWAHNAARNPRLGDNYGRPPWPLFDVRNNVIYDWGGIASGLTGDNLRANYVGNYVRPGPSSDRKRGIVVLADSAAVSTTWPATSSRAGRPSRGQPADFDRLERRPPAGHARRRAVRRAAGADDRGGAGLSRGPRPRRRDAARGGTRSTPGSSPRPRRGRAGSSTRRTRWAAGLYTPPPSPRRRRRGRPARRVGARARAGPGRPTRRGQGRRPGGLHASRGLPERAGRRRRPSAARAGAAGRAGRAAARGPGVLNIVNSSPVGATTTSPTGTAPAAISRARVAWRS